MIISEKNEKSQHCGSTCLKMSQIIEYSNKASQNSLTHRIVPLSGYIRKLSLTRAIVPQLCLLRKLLFIQSINDQNGTNQNSLTRRIIPQLHCLRKLLFHETEHFIFAKLTLQLIIPLIIPYDHLYVINILMTSDIFLTPSNLASMTIACQRHLTTLFLTHQLLS